MRPPAHFVGDRQGVVGPRLLVGAAYRNVGLPAQPRRRFRNHDAHAFPRRKRIGTIPVRIGKAAGGAERGGPRRIQETVHAGRLHHVGVAGRPVPALDQIVFHFHFGRVERVVLRRVGLVRTDPGGRGGLRRVIGRVGGRRVRVQRNDTGELGSAQATKRIGWRDVRRRQGLGQNRAAQVVVRRKGREFAVPHELRPELFARRVRFHAVAARIQHGVQPPAGAVAYDVARFFRYGQAPLEEEIHPFERLVGQFDVRVAVRIARIREGIFHHMVIVVIFLAELHDFALHRNAEERVRLVHDHHVGNLVRVHVVVGHFRFGHRKRPVHEDRRRIPTTYHFKAQREKFPGTRNPGADMHHARGIRSAELVRYVSGGDP